ncbi:MAG: GNAT family protein [Pseudomonadota bacterium]
MALRFPLALIDDREPQTRLETTRLVLRPPSERDYDAWCDLRARSKDFLEPWEPSWPEDALSRENFKKRVRRFHSNWRADSGYAFFILHKGAGTLLGGITLSNVRRGAAQSASVGYWVGAPYAGRGVMGEATRDGVLPFAFDALALHRLEAACLPSNERSRKLLVRAGFAEEGLARKYLCIDGQWRDHVLFGLIGEEWRGAKWRNARRLGAAPARETIA